MTLSAHFQADQPEPATLPETNLADCYTFDSTLPGTAKFPERDEAERRRLLEKVVLIARVFSKNYQMDVIPSPMGGWACTIDEETIAKVDKFLRGERATINDIPQEEFRAETILYNSGDIASTPEQEVLGVLRHEVGHALHSDFRAFFNGQKLAKDEGVLPSTWALVHNALEDTWINELESSDSEVVRDNIRKRCERSTTELIENVASLPKTEQLALSFIHHWLRGGAIPGIEDKEVLEAFERLKPAAERYARGRSSAANFELLKKQIWPEFKRFEEKAIEDQAIQSMASQDDGDGDGAGSGQGSSGSGGAGGSGPSGPSPAGASAAAASVPPPSSSRQQQPDPSPSESDGSPAEDQQPSEEELRAAAERFAQLPDEQKEKLLEAAREELDERQAKALEKLLPKLLKVARDEKSGLHLTSFAGPAGGEDVEKAKSEIEPLAQAKQSEEKAAQEAAAKQEQARSERTAKQLREEETKRDMLKNGFGEYESSHYQRFKGFEDSVRGIVKDFMRALGPHLPKHRTFEYEGESYFGTRLDLKDLPLRAPIEDWRIYKKRQACDAEEPRLFVSIALDNTGSMSGTKMEESLKTVLFLGRVLQDFDIPFSIRLFGERVTKIKEFRQDYDLPSQRIKPTLVRSCDASGEYTNIGSALQEIDQEMAQARRRYPESQGLVLVVSDSGANSGLTGQALANLVKDIQGRCLVQSFLLSDSNSEKREAEAQFGAENVIAVSKFPELPREAFRVLRSTFSRVFKLRMREY